MCREDLTIYEAWIDVPGGGNGFTKLRNHYTPELLQPQTQECPVNSRANNVRVE